MDYLGDVVGRNKLIEDTFWKASSVLDYLVSTIIQGSGAIIHYSDAIIQGTGITVYATMVKTFDAVLEQKTSQL